MATNYEQPGEVVEIAQASIAAGDPVMQGKLTGVSLCDTDAAGNIRLATKGVFVLSVKGANDSGSTAISVGDKIYWDGGTLNADSTNGTLFGKALEAVASGATSDIRVLLVQG